MNKHGRSDEINNDHRENAQEVLYSWDPLKQQWVQYGTIPQSAPIPLGKDTVKSKKKRISPINSIATPGTTRIKDDDIFRYVIRIAPEMKQIIAFVRECSPAKTGEYDRLLDRLHNKPNDRVAVENRLFDLGLRIAVRNALLFSIIYRIDVEDAFQAACIGVLRAIREHNTMEASSFPLYAKRWINRTMMAELPVYEKNYSLPFHEKERIEKKLRIIERKESDIGLIRELSYQDLIVLLQEDLVCRENEAIQIATTLTPFESVEVLAEEENDSSIHSDHNALCDKMIEEMAQIELHNMLETGFVQLKNDQRSRTVSILKMRYGLDEMDPMTLEEIGGKLGITRERVRQIEINGLKALRYSIESRMTVSYHEDTACCTESKPVSTSRNQNAYSRLLDSPRKTQKRTSNFTHNRSTSTKQSSLEGFVPGYKMKGLDIQNRATRVILYDSSIANLSLEKQEYLDLKRKGIDFVSDIIRAPGNMHLLDKQRDEQIITAVKKYLVMIEGRITENKRVDREGSVKSKRQKKGYGDYISGYDVIGSSIRNKKSGEIMFDASIKKLSLSRDDHIALKAKNIDLISEIVGLTSEMHFSNDEQDRRIKSAVLSYLRNAEELYK